MSAADVSDTLQLALKASGVDKVNVLHRPRLLSENGRSLRSSELGDWLKDKGIRHVRGRPYHPMTQGEIERYHRSMKNRILLENYYLPGQLELSIGEFVEYYNNQRYHESLDNRDAGRRLLRKRTGHSQVEGKHQTENHRTTTAPASAGNRSLKPQSR